MQTSHLIQQIRQDKVMGGGVMREMRNGEREGEGWVRKLRRDGWREEDSAGRQSISESDNEED